MFYAGLELSKILKQQMKLTHPWLAILIVAVCGLALATPARPQRLPRSVLSEADVYLLWSATEATAVGKRWRKGAGRGLSPRL